MADSDRAAAGDGRDPGADDARDAGVADGGNAMNGVKKFLLRMHKDEGGTAAVTFLLCLPVMMTVIAIIVQFALILNAKLVVTDAAIAAGRAAVTALPEEKPENIRKAALFMLVPISPTAKNGINQEGQEIQSALETLGVKPPSNFALRYNFADSAATVNYTQDDYKHMPGQDIEVTVAYKFYLEVPIARGILATNNETVAGVQGRYFKITSKVKVQTSHGRATEADSGTGEPLAPN
jgi:Flp pilus assembly protein TadG